MTFGQVAGARSNVPSSPVVASVAEKGPACKCKRREPFRPAPRATRNDVGLPAAVMPAHLTVQAARGACGSPFCLAEHLMGAPRRRHAVVPHLAGASAFPADDAVGRRVG